MASWLALAGSAVLMIAETNLEKVACSRLE